MGRPRASYYVRMGDLIVSATSTLDVPDSLDELRVQVSRGFAQALAWTDVIEDDDEVAAAADTTDLPPLD